MLNMSFLLTHKNFAKCLRILMIWNIFSQRTLFTLHKQVLALDIAVVDPWNVKHKASKVWASIINKNIMKYNEEEDEWDIGRAMGPGCSSNVDCCVIITTIGWADDDIPKFVHPHNHSFIRHIGKCCMRPYIPVIAMPWGRRVLQTELISLNDRLS